MKDCIFCKIAKKEIPSEIVYEDDKIVAFKDIHPVAPIHILLIPKKHIPSVADIGKKDIRLMGELIFAAKKIAEDFRIAKEGYRLLFQVHHHGGQVIEHIHLHLIAGAPFPIRQILNESNKL